MSYSWKSHAFTMKAQWKRLEPSIRRMRFDRSPAVPKNLEEYTVHVAQMAKEQADEQAKKLEAAKADLEVAIRTGRKPVALFGAKHFGDGRCGVLGQKTIWAREWSPEPGRPAARWPDAGEFKEEGDERFTSSFGRFLPLLRYPGNETVNWKQRPRLLEYPFDVIMPVPRNTPVYIPGLYGFGIELDRFGIPFDDDDEPFGRTAVAYHLDDKTENCYLWQWDEQYEFMKRWGNDQIYNYGDPVYSCSGDEDDEPLATIEGPSTVSEEYEAAATPSDSSTACAEDTEDKKSKEDKAFRFNPKACEFVSHLSTPPSEEEDEEKEKTKVEVTPTTTAPPSATTAPQGFDIWAMIDQINALSIASYAKDLTDATAHKHNFSLTNTNDSARTPGFTSGSSIAEEEDECPEDDDNQTAAECEPIILGNYQTHRQGSFAAIGSERRSSGSVSPVPFGLLGDDAESEVDEGGVALEGAASFNTVVPGGNVESPQLSPKTVPASLALAIHVQETFEKDEDEMPATLAGLVAQSYADRDEY